MMKSVPPSDFSLVVDGGSSNVAFVLSAAKELKDRRGKCLAATIQAAKRLTAAIDSSVFFLGNPTRYSVKDLETHGVALFDENETRASLIAPVMKEINELESTTRIVIIGAKRVFDLGDWDFKTPPITFMASKHFDRCRPVTGEHALIEALHDPIERVTIPLNSFAPTAWNNADYQFVLVDGRLFLRGDQPHAFDVRVTGILLGGTPPTAQLLHASGRESNWELSREPSAENHTTEIELLDIEAQVYRSMVRRTRFSCPHCGEAHASHTLHCANDLSPRFRFQGRPILASLHRSRRRGLFLCSDDGERVRCEFVGQSFLDGDRGRLYFALERQRLYSVTLAGGSVDWKTVRRIPANRFELGEHRHVVVYH